jgi:hypothetical protein
MDKCQPFILWSLGALFWLQFADNGLGSVGTNYRNTSMITATSSPHLDVIFETPFAPCACVHLNKISYYPSCAQPPQNLRTLPLYRSHTITCSTLDLPFNHLPNSSIPWNPMSPTMAAPAAPAQDTGTWWAIHLSSAQADTATARPIRGAPVASCKTASPPRGSAFAPSTYTTTWTTKTSLASLALAAAWAA